MIEPPRLMMTTGPVEVSPRVLRALGNRMIHHGRPEFIRLYEEMLIDLQTIWKTRSDMVVLHGEGIIGVEASIASMIEPGDKVVVASAGVFGFWFRQLVESHQGVPVIVGSDRRKRTKMESVKEVLDQHNDAALVIAVHCDTVSSIVDDLEGICKEAKKRGIPTAADAISTIAGQDFRADEWGIDLAIGTGQHCLSCPPGLTPVSVSQDAWKRMEEKKHPVRNSYLSFLDMRETWFKGKYFPYTPLVSEVYAMAESCKEILEEGLDNVFARHRDTAETVRKGVVGMGLELFPEDSRSAAEVVTTFLLPDGIEDSKLIEAVLSKHGILLGGGYRDLKGKIVRVGHSGYSSTRANAIASLAAIEEELRAMGHDCRPGSAVAAALS